MVPQKFEDTSSFTVRGELEALVERDLLGPWDGPHEEFPPRAAGPLERYLVGRLGPRHAPGTTLDAADEVPDAELAGDTDPSDAELPELLTMQNAGRMWASSMGLSCTVAGNVNVLSVTVTWGQYGKSQILDDQGKTRTTWARKHINLTNEVRLDGKPTDTITLHGDDAAGIHLRTDVRAVSAPDGTLRRFVELSLINGQREARSTRDTAWLFQPEISVTAPDGSASVFLPVGDPLDEVAAPNADFEDRHLQLLYRNVLKYADGRNVAVHPEVHVEADSDTDLPSATAHSTTAERRAWKLTTTWMPTFDVPATIAPSPADTPGLAGLELSMDQLAALPPDELGAALRPLADGYRGWLDARKQESASLSDPLRPTADAAVFKATSIADRIAAGINLLIDDSPDGRNALAAFRFANQAMADQRRHTVLSALRDEATAAGRTLSYPEALHLVEAQGAKGASWRPFQLAFVLLNIPALTIPTHPERGANAAALVDLLFFPTGGGKTEAYLGLTAFTFAIRRLQGTIGIGNDARSGEAGVAVLMRYTLRLLTAQQFQRAAALVCAAEMLRRAAPETWGTTPFRIGLWVGSGVSPNWYDEAREEIEYAKQSGRGDRVKVLQTLSCPWCGQRLVGHDDLVPQHETRRILLYCGNGEGPDACPFSYLRARGEGLPILTVDEEIYRFAPALVIATVDKLAQLPWRGYAGLLFGRAHLRCPRHGYRHHDLDAKVGCTDRHNASGAFPGTTTEPVVRLRPPDLIVQDELHLISGALGTTVGLFEAAVDDLCTWYAPAPGGADPADSAGPRTVAVGPKIVASTATTKRAKDQVRRLFARKLDIFPPQVLDISDTFFSRQVPISEDSPGRRYLGVCAHGVRLKAAEIRLAEILLIAGQTLFDKYGAPADPYMTVVGYFNATRELAGMRRLLDDDVTTRVRLNGHRRGLSDRLTSTGMLTVTELTSRISSADISAALKRLETGFDPEYATTARRRAYGQEYATAAKEKRETPTRPEQNGVDAVVATSMLQVGVDVPRFGLMVVTGQPKNTAEYIQASSRVGRDAARPGLVVTLYNWSRPRDLAHYEDFEHYHGTFYRQVEALSVTPYARRALDRGTAATYVAAVRHAVEAHSRNHDAQDVDLDADDSIANEVRDRLLNRAQAAGGNRARDYLAERIDTFRDRWKNLKTGGARLGYEAGTYKKQPVAGLLEKATGAWTDRTAGMSMRETENEINLLVPGSEDLLFGKTYGAPGWSFGGAEGATGEVGGEPAAAADAGVEVDGDEFGETGTTGRKG
jgi:Helicase conserved C-terminal domain